MPPLTLSTLANLCNHLQVAKFLVENCQEAARGVESNANQLARHETGEVKSSSSSSSSSSSLFSVQRARSAAALLRTLIDVRSVDQLAKLSTAGIEHLIRNEN